MNRARPAGVDALLGSALLLLQLGFFVQVLGRQPLWGGLSRAVALLSEVLAIVGESMLCFVAGLLAGWLFGRSGTREEERQTARTMYMGATIVLIVGPVLMNLVRLPVVLDDIRYAHFSLSLATASIVTATVLPFVTSRGALLLAVLLYSGGWLLRNSWQGAPGWTALLLELLSGARSVSLDFGHAFLQWSGLFLAAAAMGRSYAILTTTDQRVAWLQTAARVAIRTVLLALFLRGLTLVPAVRSQVGAQEWLSVFAVLSASPACVGTFGAASVALCCGSLALTERHGLPKVLWPVARLGRAGFVTWVVLVFVFRDVLFRLDLSRPTLWPVVLVALLVLVWTMVTLLPDNERSRVFPLGIT